MPKLPREQLELPFTAEPADESDALGRGQHRQAVGAPLQSVEYVPRKPVEREAPPPQRLRKHS